MSWRRLRALVQAAIDDFHLKDHPIEDAAEALGTPEELVDAGKVASFGASIDDPERAAAFGRGPHGTALEHRLNLFEGDHRMLEVCEELGMASLNRTPLGMGLLSGTWNRGTRFAADDICSTWDLDAEPGRRIDAVEALREILTADGATSRRATAPPAPAAPPRAPR